MFINSRSNPQVALAGGVHEHVLATNFSDESVVAAGMLIYGNENVSVSSVALQEPKMSTGNKKKLEKVWNWNTTNLLLLSSTQI